jgi:hypothetical protein
MISNLPRWIVTNSRLPAIFGRFYIGRPFTAQSIAAWIFLPGTSTTMPVLRHESRHVDQFYVGWAIGLALWLLLTPGWWWLLATPFVRFVAYGVSGLYAKVTGRPYRQNWFERDARRAAGEPV